MSTLVRQNAKIENPGNPAWWSRDLLSIESLFEKAVAETLPNHAAELFRAREFARQIHASQSREGGGPYIIHPLRVALSLMKEIMVDDPTLVLCAILHDVIEDSDRTRKDLESEFGHAVAALVATVSRGPDEKRPRQGDAPDSPYFNRIRLAAEPAIVLKTADKVDNLRDGLFHPKQEKRRALIQEVENVYLPLVSAVQSSGLRSRLTAMLEVARESHSLRSLTGILERQVSLTAQGDFVDVPVACLGEPLTHYLLFNPGLIGWLSDDGVRLTKSSPSPRQIAANVVLKYAQFIEGGRVGELLELAGIPLELATPRNQDHWNTVATQLRELNRLLNTDNVPGWCAPALEASSHSLLLLLVHSVLYRPANRIFPMWQADYGASLANDLGATCYGNVPAGMNSHHFHEFLFFLLNNREAIWRYSKGIGTLTRTQAVFLAAEPLSQVPARTLWAFRLLSEYLDVVTDKDENGRTESVSEAFGKIWDTIHDASFEAADLSRIQQKPLHEAVAGFPTVSTQLTEIIGLQQVREMFARKNRPKDLALLLKLLINDSASLSKTSIPWICFDASEFVKRERELFAEGSGVHIDEQTTIANLEPSGILIQRISTNPQVVRVFPARRFALKNRLPELSDEDISKIESEDYLATVIFDTTILDRQKGGEELWTPRVYRIIDTIAALDPDNVQTIHVELRGPQDNERFVTWLPLPRMHDTDVARQLGRKEVLARYLVAQIYNYAITRCIVSARVECESLDSDRADQGFTTQTLMEAIRAADKAGGYGTFGYFVESFNYSPFQISPTSIPEGNLRFDHSDMQSGAFLGIDIGGTDVKFTLFVNGKPQPQGTHGYLGKTPTFPHKAKVPPHAEALEFCERLITKIDEWLDRSADTWQHLSGIGISWPGAVRENRIACFSGTLAGLSYEGRHFGQQASASDIHSFPFLDIFRAALNKVAKERKFELNPNLTLVIENDGNAEAFGNYCDRVLQFKNKPGGKLIAKLGTSLAGGRVRPDSSIADDVGEFSKIVLKLNPQPAKDAKPPGSPQGVAREYISSLGVRNLSRCFKFRGNFLFECQGDENLEELKTRIEAVELGGMLDLWQAGMPDASYLDHLVKTDNAPTDTVSLKMDLIKAALPTYVHARGNEWKKRKFGDKGKEFSRAEIDRRGWSRLYWLCTGEHQDYPHLPESKIPDYFPYDLLAEKIEGTVALFSQLGLQIAHLVAALYNIYRRDSFNEVILAGGVLSGATGELIKTQTEKFLLKYYDKIYGPGKSLPVDAIQLAQTEDREIIGPFGAAMLANRVHKGNRLVAMRAVIDLQIRQMAPGAIISFIEIQNIIHNQGVLVTPFEIREYLFTKVAESQIIPQDQGETFTRCLAAP